MIHELGLSVNRWNDIDSTGIWQAGLTDQTIR